MKRLIDIIIAVCALLLLSPIMLFVILAICLYDRGPVFFKQERVGRFGKTFLIYKFRSMVVNAEQVGGYSTADKDPRITPVGRFIRRTSLDELPQLINVLNGDMSIVGPRPDVPAQKTLYTPEEWSLRNSVRPGITGLAQATLRSAATQAQRTVLDLRYARERNIGLDMKIIAMTFTQVLTKGGN
ncbi:MAG: sugar transferase [Massilia sp.]|nr:sugar transferase [Massilia sp.]